MQQFSPAPTQSSQQDNDAPRDQMVLREEMERYLEDLLIQEGRLPEKTAGSEAHTGLTPDETENQCVLPSNELKPLRTAALGLTDANYTATTEETAPIESS